MSDFFVGAVAASGDGAVQSLRKMVSRADPGEAESVRQLEESVLVKEPRLSETLPPPPPPESRALEPGESNKLKHRESTHPGDVDIYA